MIFCCYRDPIAYALGFLDCKDISARCMLSIFQFFATKTDASVLRMLNGSPAERLLKPITNYIEARGGRIHTRVVCKCVWLLVLAAAWLLLVLSERWRACGSPAVETVAGVWTSVMSVGVDAC